jgi:hypothetical protein
MEEDTLWGLGVRMIATDGLRPHEVWHIDGLPDRHGLITVGVAARHIRVTRTGFRAAVPLPVEWVEPYRATYVQRRGTGKQQPSPSPNHEQWGGPALRAVICNKLLAR